MTRTARQSLGPDNDGFTLLELIVTLGLLALIVTAIMGGLNTGRRVWQIRTELDQLAAVGAARSVLEARLSDAMPLTQQSPSGLATLAFAGSGDSLDFVTPLSQSLGGGGLFRQTVKLAKVMLPNGRTRQNLVVEETLFGDAPPPAGDSVLPRQAVLVEDVAAVAIRYNNPVAASPSPVWSATWLHKDALPWLIGITVVFPSGDPRHWPELLVAPRAALVDQ